MTTRDAYWFGIDKMEAAEGIYGRHHRATAYRKGHVFALLAARPLRLRTFTLIRIGTRLVGNGGSLRMRFVGADTKTARPLEMPYPVELLNGGLDWKSPDHRATRTAAAAYAVGP